MLKSNGQFWSNMILSTRYSSPPQTPSTFRSPSLSSSNQSPTRKYQEEEEDDEEEIVIISDVEEPAKMKKPKSKKKRRRGNLPKDVTAVLKEWLKEHSGHPYPTDEEKKSLVEKTQLSLNQISNWFINARRRLLPSLLAIDNTEIIKNKSVKRKSKNELGIKRGRGGGTCAYVMTRNNSLCIR